MEIEPTLHDPPKRPRRSSYGGSSTTTPQPESERPRHIPPSVRASTAAAYERQPPHPYEIPIEAAPAWERRRHFDPDQQGRQDEEDDVVVEERQRLSERQRLLALARYKEREVAKTLSNKNAEMEDNRNAVAERMAELVNGFGYTLAEKDETIHRLQHELDMWKGRAKDANSKLKGAIHTLALNEKDYEERIERQRAKIQSQAEELKKLKSRSELIGEAADAAKKRLAEASRAQEHLEIQRARAVEQLENARMEKARIEGEMKALSKRLDGANSENNRLVTDLRRAERQIEGLEAQLTTVNKTKVTTLLEQRDELNAELERVHRNNARLLGLFSTMATSCTAAEATHRAAGLLKVINGNFSYLSEQKDAHIRDNATAHAKAQDFETAVREHYRITPNGRHEPIIVLDTDPATLFKQGDPKADGNGEEYDAWIPTKAWNIMSSFRRRYFSDWTPPAGASTHVFNVLLKELWKALRSTSLGMDGQGDGGLLHRHQPKLVTCPVCQRKREASTEANGGPGCQPARSAALNDEVVDRSPSGATNSLSKNAPFSPLGDILKDGAVLDAVNAISGLKQVMKAVENDLVFPTGAIQYSEVKTILRHALKTVHTLLSRVQRLESEFKATSAGKGSLYEASKGFSSLTLNEVAPSIEQRTAEFIAKIDKLITAALCFDYNASVGKSGADKEHLSWHGLTAELETCRDALRGTRRDALSFRDDLLHITTNRIPNQRW